MVAEDQFSGSVLDARNGKLVISKGYGYAEEGTHIANHADTRVLIHWITMQFTTMAIVMRA